MSEATVWKAEGEAGAPTGSWSNKVFLTWACCSTFARLAAQIGQALADNVADLDPKPTSHIQSTEYSFFLPQKMHFKMIIFAFEMFWLQVI